MPKLDPHKLRVELEVTPDWWSRLGGKALGCSEQIASEMSADLIARSMLLATAAFVTCEVRLSRSALKILTFVPEDGTFAAVCEKAGQLRERMNALHVGVLP